MIEASAKLDDAGGPFADTPPRARGGAAGLEFAVLGGATALAAYDDAAIRLAHAPPQSSAWVRLWADTVNSDIIVAMIRHRGHAIFALPLEILSRGPFRIARLPGGTHANGNFAPTDRGEPPRRGDLDALLAAIAKARPDIDLVLMERLAPERDGLDNPLLLLPAAPSPDIGLAVNLDGGFDGVMSRTSGKRKRKKHRAQARKFEAVGAIAVARASTPAEVNSLLDIFFTLKGERLKRLGVDDVFAPPAIRAFFKRLFSEAVDSDTPLFVLDRLSVSGKVRAITGSSILENRVICEFSAITQDDLTPASPGEYLFFENIQAACVDNKAIYDFSVGDEPFKRLWCDIETTFADVRAPLSLKGAALSSAIGGRASLVRAVKSNNRLWPMLRRWRRREAGEPAGEDDS